MQKKDQKFGLFLLLANQSCKELKKLVVRMSLDRDSFSQLDDDATRTTAATTIAMIAAAFKGSLRITL